MFKLNQNKDRSRHFEFSYVFATSEVSVHSNVSYSQFVISNFHMFSRCQKSGCIRMWAILNH